VLYRQGLWQKSEPRFLATVSAYERLGKKTEYVMGWNALPYTIVCGQLGYNLGIIGRVTEAKNLFKKGYTPELEQVCNLTTKMAYCSWQGLFISLIGEDPFGAATRMDQLVELAERSDSPFLILVFSVARANVFLGMGNYDSALIIGEKVLKAIKGRSIRTGHVINLYYDLVLAGVESGNLDSAWGYYAEGLPLVELAPHWWKPRFDFLKGLLTMAESVYDCNQVESYFEKSISADEMVGGVVPAAQTRYYLARMLAQKNEVGRTRGILTELCSHFQNWNIPVWQKKCEKELYALSSLE